MRVKGWIQLQLIPKAVVEEIVEGLMGKVFALVEEIAGLLVDLKSQTENLQYYIVCLFFLLLFLLNDKGLPGKE